MELQRYVLPIAAALFLLFVLFQFRPRTTERRALLVQLRDARARARATGSPEERTAHLLEAAEAAAGAGRARTAQWMFLRAARSAPTDALVIERAARSLAARPRLLETLLWRRLAASLEVDGAALPVRIASARELATLYDGPLRDAHQARVLSRLVELETAAGRLRG